MTCFRVEAPALSIRLCPEWTQGDLRDRLVQNGSTEPSPQLGPEQTPAPLARGPVGQVVTGPQGVLEAAPSGTGPWPLHTPGGMVSHPSTIALVLQGIVDGGNQPASSFKNLRICFSKQPIPISHGHAPASLSDQII